MAARLFTGDLVLESVRGPARRSVVTGLFTSDLVLESVTGPARRSGNAFWGDALLFIRLVAVLCSCSTTVSRVATFSRERVRSTPLYSYLVTLSCERVS